MSLFHDVKRLLTGEFSSTEPMGSVPSTAVGEASQPTFSTPAQTFWTLASGTSRNSHQERTVSYDNNQISGRCVGRIGELSGELMLYPFEDMPTWLTSLHLRLTVETQHGQMRISLLEPSGTITSLSAPCTLEGQFALTNGRLALRCQTDASFVRGLRYEALIR